MKMATPCFCFSAARDSNPTALIAQSPSSSSLEATSTMDLDVALKELGMLSTYAEGRTEYLMEKAARARRCSSEESFCIGKVVRDSFNRAYNCYENLTPKVSCFLGKENAVYFRNDELHSISPQLKRSHTRKYRPYDLLVVRKRHSPVEFEVLPTSIEIAEEFTPFLLNPKSHHQESSVVNKSNPSSPAKSKYSLTRSLSYDDVTSLAGGGDEESRCSTVMLHPACSKPTSLDKLSIKLANPLRVAEIDLMSRQISMLNVNS